MRAHRLIARLSASCIAMTLFFGSAASADSITVQADRLNMRKEADSSSKSVGIVRKGETLSFISEDGDWYQIKNGNQIGFVMRDYVSLNEKELASDVAANTQAVSPSLKGRTVGRINMRALPTTSSDVVKVVPDQAQVEIVGMCGVWYQVKYSGRTGYLMAQYLTVESSDISAPSQPNSSTTVQPETPPVENGTVADTIYSVAQYGLTTTRINMRKNPTTSASVVKVIDKQNKVTILGENGSWYLISFSGKTGYISREYVTLTESDSDVQPPVETDRLTVYAAPCGGKLTERVNMREEASTSSDIVTVLAKKSTVSVLGEQGSFYQVKAGTRIGFVAKAYLTLTDPIPTDQDSTPVQDTVYSKAKEGMTTVKVNMRREPEGDVLHTLAADTSVLLIGERGGWYLVSWNETTGYISKSYITEKASAPSAPSQPNNNTTVTPETPQPDTSKGTTAYVTGSVNMRKGAGTNYGIIKVLSRGTEITFYSLNDGWYYVKAGNDTGYVSSKYVTTTKIETPAPSAPSAPEEVSGKVRQADWWTSDIQKVFARGVVATVTDVETGISWQVKRSGGTNHADVQPLTAADTAKMKQAYGGKWSWNRRAIWVTINGVSYAASMNGMPHGSGSITTNNFDGHHCIHFLNSRTHTGNRWDTQHQAMVQKAYNAGQ